MRDHQFQKRGEMSTALSLREWEKSLIREIQYNIFQVIRADRIYCLSCPRKKV
jgi:hypothetical protein